MTLQINQTIITPQNGFEIARSKGVASPSIVETVSSILQNVEKNGDKALIEYSNKFDNAGFISPSDIIHRVSKNIQIDNAIKDAIHVAIGNLSAFHELQTPKNITLENNGITLRKEYRPIDRVGLYVPSGDAPLVSTLMMLCVPSKIAQNPVQVLCVPPRGITPEIEYIAEVFGIEFIYKLGGAQAIAGMAFGTDTVPKVDKIFGPGNAFVNEAKKATSANGTVAIDMPAGPSEVMVIFSKDSFNAEYIASDLLSQAEHDPLAGIVCMGDDEKCIRQVIAACERQSQTLSRCEIALKSMSNAQFIKTDIQNAIRLSNEYAPEHLILHLQNPSEYIPQITNAGSVFLGQYTPEVLGDYASGTNHVLPTNGCPRMYSGLGVESFMKAVTFQHATKSGFEAIGKTLSTLADLERLDAHSFAASIRLDKNKK